MKHLHSITQVRNVVPPGLDPAHSISTSAGAAPLVTSVTSVLFGAHRYVRLPGCAFWIRCASTPDVMSASTAPSALTTINMPAGLWLSWMHATLIAVYMAVAESGAGRR
jgi:hypothetical protein